MLSSFKKSDLKIFLVRPVIASGLLVLSIIAIFYQTAWSIVDIWLRSGTFTHGFLVIPITLWLCWQKRDVIRQLSPFPRYSLLIAVAGCGFLWLIASLVDVLVVQQLALVGLLVAACWALMGHQITRALAFPLAFLFFAVPMGEGLVPQMMEFTATFTVAMVKLTGVPVYREGLFFYLPSGNWSVVEACSGIRYLIASVTLGCLFAYLNYQSMTKRVIFILVSILVPILANGMRAYIIVMIGHLSDMKLATGVDHLIYGWVFFGFVMAILFAVGAIWRDTNVSPAQCCPDLRHDNDFVVKGHRAGLFLPAILVFSVAAVWPLLATAIEHRPPPAVRAPLHAPAFVQGWNSPGQHTWTWQPISIGASETIQQFYEKGDHPVSLFVAQYLQQKQGAELINSQNTLVDTSNKRWRIIDRQKISLDIDGRSFSVQQARVKGEGLEFLVWSWYRLGERFTANPYVAKIFEAIAKMTFAREDSAWLVMATPIDYFSAMETDAEAKAQKILEQFLRDTLPQVAHQLDLVVGESEK